MTPSELYRANAAECDRAAAKSALPRDRASFRQMAERWRTLAEQADASARAPEPRSFADRPR